MHTIPLSYQFYYASLELVLHGFTKGSVYNEFKEEFFEFIFRFFSSPRIKVDVLSKPRPLAKEMALWTFFKTKPWRRACLSAL